MSIPATRSDGATRRFVVHLSRQPRDRGRVVRAATFHDAALVFTETFRPIPDDEGAIKLSLTDLDTGEQQDATIDVARPGLTDLQVRRARLEARAAGRVEPTAASSPAEAPPPTPPAAPQRDLRRIAINGTAAAAVLLVAVIGVTRLVRENTGAAPWTDMAPAGQAAPRLNSAVLSAPSTEAGAAATSRTAYQRPAFAASVRPDSRRYSAPSPAPEAAIPEPQIDIAAPLAVPSIDAVIDQVQAQAATSPAEPDSAPLIVRRTAEREALGSDDTGRPSEGSDAPQRLSSGIEGASPPAGATQP